LRHHDYRQDKANLALPGEVDERKELEDCTVARSVCAGDTWLALRDEKTREVTNGKRIPLLMKASPAIARAR